MSCLFQPRSVSVAEREPFEERRITGDAAERGAGDHRVGFLLVSIPNPCEMPAITQVALERFSRRAQLVAGFDTLGAVTL